MKRILYIIVWCIPVMAAAQQAVDTNPEALKESRKLTWEAGKDLDSDDFVNAEAKYRRAIAKSEENPAAPYNLGNAYYETESFSEAFGRFKEAGERAGEKPDKHKAYHNMGNVYMQRKEYEQAIKFFTKAVEIDPDFLQVYKNMALTYDSVGKHKEALDCLKRALELEEISS